MVWVLRGLSRDAIGVDLSVVHGYRLNGSRMDGESISA